MEFANFIEGVYIYIYTFIYKVGRRDKAIQGGHGPSRILFLKLKVYLFYDIFRIWANENYF